MDGPNKLVSDACTWGVLRRARRLAQQADDQASVAAAEEHLELVQAAHAAHVADCGGEVEAAVAQVKAQLHTSAKVK